jgi:hypothetical protein
MEEWLGRLDKLDQLGNRQGFGGKRQSEEKKECQTAGEKHNKLSAISYQLSAKNLSETAG